MRNMREHSHLCSPGNERGEREHREHPPLGVFPCSHPRAARPLGRVVADIAERVARLSPSHRDPEQFHMDKHTLAAELRALARAMEAA